MVVVEVLAITMRKRMWCLAVVVAVLEAWVDQFPLTEEPAAEVADLTRERITQPMAVHKILRVTKGALLVELAPAMEEAGERVEPLEAAAAVEIARVTMAAAAAELEGVQPGLA